MKIVKVLLCIIITINLPAQAKDYTLKANTNLATQIELNDEIKWSLDGGVFKNIDEGIYIEESGTYKVLLLNIDNSLSVINVNITGGLSDTKKQSETLYIDNKGPKLQLYWKNIENIGESIVVGPNSQLHWESNDKTAKHQVYINNKILDNTSSPILFNVEMTDLSIKSVDEFNNLTQTTIEFEKDFTPPELDWKLASPSLFKNDKWHSKKAVKLIITPQQGIVYQLNGKPIKFDNNSLKINNNSILSASDYLGNTSKKTIQWVEDNEAPLFITKTLENIEGEEQIIVKKITINSDQKIQISTRDNGIGILNSYFFSKNRKWEPLPKTFEFLKPGQYRIKVKSEDILGNSSKNKIIVRVKR